MNATLADERAALLEAALARAGEEGWTQACLRRAARDCGLDAAAARLHFPRGVDEALEALDDLFDSRAAAAVDVESAARLPVRERIATLAFARLSVMAPHRRAVRRVVARRASPAGAAAATRALLRTADRIWRLAGVSSTGFDYYTRRGLLAAVLGTTALCWLGDDSDGFAATRAFLDRRIADVLRFGKARAALDRARGRLRSPLARALRAAGTLSARAR